MGVLLAYTDTGWRAVGCTEQSLPPVTVLVIREAGTYTGNPWDQPHVLYYRVGGVELVNEIDGIFTGSDQPGGTFDLSTYEPTMPPSTARSWFYDLRDPVTGAAVSSIGGAAGSYTVGSPSRHTFFNNDVWPTPTAPPDETGRLTLWDSAQWVREACEDDAGGHPLLMDLNHGTGLAPDWVQVACLTPV